MRWTSGRQCTVVHAIMALLEPPKIAIRMLRP